MPTLKQSVISMTPEFLKIFMIRVRVRIIENINKYIISFSIRETKRENVFYKFNSTILFLGQR